MPYNKTAVHPLPAKSADDTRYTLRVPIYSSMTDENDRILPGVLLKLIDVAGCVPAKRHLGSVLDPVTASIDRMDFYAPVHPWDIIILDSRLTRVWRTSMESRIVVTSWSFRTEEVRCIANAYMVTVAVAHEASQKALPEQIAPLSVVTPEDNLLARSADLRKEYRQFEKSRTPFVPIVAEEDNPLAVEAVMTPRDSNGLARNVFGGVILSQMHQAAHSLLQTFLGRDSFACARQDRMDFVEPALLGETLRSRAVITATGTTSVEVQVECEARMSEDQAWRLVATTYFIFVGVDEQGRPNAVPVWKPSTPRQKERQLGAQARRRMRDDERTYFGATL